ncbi:MAG: type II restriction endonuclease [Crocosphaera sp.]
MTRGINNIIENEGNEDGITAFILDRNLPVDEIEAANLAQEVINNPPKQGFLSISNALQWRLQYRRVISLAGQEEGLIDIYRTN